MRQEVGGALIWPFLPWLWKGDYRVSEACERAIICVNENNERIFPRSSKIPFLWAPFNDPGEDLTIGHLNVIEEFATAFRDSYGLAVHCFAGRNRSTATCWFLMRRIARMTTYEIDALFSQGNSNVGMRRELAEKMKSLTGYDYLEHWIG